MKMLLPLLAAALLLGTFLSAPRAADLDVLKAGIIGLDTSHVVAFTELLNDPEGRTATLAGVRVVAAYPGGSPDVPASRDRVEGFTKHAARQVPASRSSTRSTPCWRRWTSCCWRASTAGRTWSRSSRSSRRASRSSSTSRSPARWPTPSRSIDLAKETDTPCLLQLVAALQPRHPGDARTTRRSARCSAATPTARARWRSTTPTCSGTASTASRRCSPSWAPAASR